MAITPRNGLLEHRTKRIKLPHQKEPYWTKIGQGVFLGYYRSGTGGTWWARKLVAGTKRYLKSALGTADDHRSANGIDCLSYFEAADKARHLADEHVRKDAAAPLKPANVADAAQAYLTWFRTARKSVIQTESTIKVFILPTLGAIPLPDLTTARLLAWLDAIATAPPRRRQPRISQTAAPKVVVELTDAQKRARRASANRIFNVLRAVLNHAFRHGMVADDVAWRRVESFRDCDEPAVRFLTTQECQRLVNACRPDLRQLTKAALFTGARFGELAGLVCAEFNLETGLLHIRPGKSGKSRHIPLNAEGLDFFRAITKGRPSDAPILLHQSGLPWCKNQYVRPLSDACSAARIEPAISFHDLRHTYASLLAQAGADLLTIAKLLGHADTRITARHYAHLCDKTLGAAVMAFLPSFQPAVDITP